VKKGEKEYNVSKADSWRKSIQMGHFLGRANPTMGFQLEGREKTSKKKPNETNNL